LVLASKLSCKRENKTKEAYVGRPSTETGVHLDRYPESLKKVFEAHGGLLHWKKKKVWLSSMGKNAIPWTFKLEWTGWTFRRIPLVLIAIRYGCITKDSAVKGDAVFYWSHL
jgi:hypothetical protein